MAASFAGQIPDDVTGPDRDKVHRVLISAAAGAERRQAWGVAGYGPTVTLRTLLWFEPIGDAPRSLMGVTLSGRSGGTTLDALEHLRGVGYRASLCADGSVAVAFPETHAAKTLLPARS